MDNLLALLPLLACPLVMGAMVWLMRGSQPTQSPAATPALGTPASSPVAAAHTEPDSVERAGMQSASHPLTRCLNWRVVAGLGMTGVVVWALAPGVIWAALPILILAACPLSMLLMMRGVHAMPPPRPGQMSLPPAPPEAPGGRIAGLQGRPSEVRSQADALAREITALERSAAEGHHSAIAGPGEHRRGAT